MKKRYLISFIFFAILAFGFSLFAYNARANSIFARLQNAEKNGFVLIAKLPRGTECKDGILENAKSVPYRRVGPNAFQTDSLYFKNKRLDFTSSTIKFSFELGAPSIIHKYAISLDCRYIYWSTFGLPPENVKLASVASNHSAEHSFFSKIDGNDLREVHQNAYVENSGEPYEIWNPSFLTNDGRWAFQFYLSPDPNKDDWQAYQSNPTHPWYSEGMNAEEVSGHGAKHVSMAVFGINPDTLQTISIPLKDLDKPGYKDVVSWLKKQFDEYQRSKYDTSIK